MKVNPRKYDICFNCSDIENEDYEFTIQYLREIRIPIRRGCFGSKRPHLKYICSNCGKEVW